MELIFTGTLTNSSSTEKLYLNDIAATLTGTSAESLTLNSTAFYSNVPGVLLPNATYTGVLFRIALNGNAPAGDYSGTIVFKGGAGILESDALTSAAFSVLSPSVSIVATDASAGESGPDDGTFTISRTGGTEIPLAVSWTIAGSAVNGTDYQAIPGSLTIPAGAATAAVVITPIPNQTAEGNRSVLLSLLPSTEYTGMAPAADTLTIQDKPADAWRLLQFGPAANDPAAADAEDWDFDGASNLIEYALGLDPRSPFSAVIPAVAAGEQLILTYVPNPAATDVNYFVETSTDLTAWSSSGVEAIQPPHGSPAGTFAFRSVVSPAAGSRAFLRLRVER
jgi:hypothetical protein